METSPNLEVRGICLPNEEVRTFWVRDGRISTSPVGPADVVAQCGWIVPGLVDAHCHIGLGPQGAMTLEDAIGQAKSDRDAGALLVRDCGSPVDTRPLLEHPDLPTIVRAGRHIARTKRYLPGVGLEIEPAELPATVAEQAKYGGGWVKLVGDWIDRSVGDLTPVWPADLLKETVKQAHLAGAKVAVHTFCEEALPDLLAAKVDSIEHGTGLTDVLIGQMATSKTALVPTLINIDNFPLFADRGHKYPAYAKRMRKMYEGSRGRIREAYEAGVPIYAGTDAGTGISHGRVVDEIRALHEAGMSTVDALAAGSWAAREWLGFPNLVDGAPADFVVYDSDPRRDLSVLKSPARIVLNGRVIK